MFFLGYHIHSFTEGEAADVFFSSTAMSKIVFHKYNFVKMKISDGIELFSSGIEKV